MFVSKKTKNKMIVVSVLSDMDKDKGKGPTYPPALPFHVLPPSGPIPYNALLLFIFNVNHVINVLVAISIFHFKHFFLSSFLIDVLRIPVNMTITLPHNL